MESLSKQEKAFFENIVPGKDKLIVKPFNVYNGKLIIESKAKTQGEVVASNSKDYKVGDVVGWGSSVFAEEIMIEELKESSTKGRYVTFISSTIAYTNNNPKEVEDVIIEEIEG